MVLDLWKLRQDLTIEAVQLHYLMGKKERNFKVEGISEPDKTIKGIQHDQFNDSPVKVSDGSERGCEWEKTHTQCWWLWTLSLSRDDSCVLFTYLGSEKQLPSHLQRPSSHYRHSVKVCYKKKSKKKKAHFWIKLQTLLCWDFLFLSNRTLLVSGPQEGQLPVGGHRR